MQTGMGEIVGDNLPIFQSVTPRLFAHCIGEHLYKGERCLSPYPRHQIEHHSGQPGIMHHRWDAVQSILSAPTQKCNLNQTIDLSDK